MSGGANPVKDLARTAHLQFVHVGPGIGELRVLPGAVAAGAPQMRNTQIPLIYRHVAPQDLAQIMLEIVELAGRIAQIEQAGLQQGGAAEKMAAAGDGNAGRAAYR